MRTFSLAALVLALVAVLTPVPAFAVQSGDQQMVKLANGTWWGNVGDHVVLEFKEGIAVRKITGKVTKIEKGIITVEGVMDGRKVTRPIFATEIRSLKTVEGGAQEPEVQESDTAQPKAPTAPKTASKGTTSGGKVSVGDKALAKQGEGDKQLGVSTGESSGRFDDEGYELDVNGYRISPKKGVFVLPFVDGVGETARAYEIHRMGEEADKWGPGQVIVLEIDSPGGLVTEIYKISDTLRELRKRHRVVAWVKKAISAAACTAMHCDEIYFQTIGALGATTMIRGDVSVQDPSLYQFMAEMAREVEYSGRPAIVLYAMIKAKAVLTYTKDPVTGKVTFHDHVTGQPGEVVLSDEVDNLVFNASNALDCGFSKGTADTTAELAELMGLPEWYEISDFGRKMAADWKKLFEDCQKDVQMQIARITQINRGSNVEQIMAEIRAIEKLIYWTRRCLACTELSGVPSMDQLERMLTDRRRTLVEIRKNERGNNR